MSLRGPGLMVVSLSAVLCSILLKVNFQTNVAALIIMVYMNLVYLLSMHEFDGGSMGGGW